METGRRIIQVGDIVIALLPSMPVRICEVVAIHDDYLILNIGFAVMKVDRGHVLSPEYIKQRYE